MKPTQYYYFNMGCTIYFGNDSNYTFFKSMDRHPIADVEREVVRLNKASGLIAPKPDIDWDEEK